MTKKRYLSSLLLLCAGGLMLTTACGKSSSSSSVDGDNTTSGASASVTIDADTTSLSDSSVISDTLYGLFLEDINFAVDGGLYAELIKNNSFEYGSDAANGTKHAWTNSNSSVLDFSVSDGTSDESYLNSANPHYAVLTNSSTDSTVYEGIANSGYLDGLAVAGGEEYEVSLYIRSADYSGSVRVALESKDGTVYAESFIDSITENWQKFDTILSTNESISSNLRFCVEITSGSVDIDMVSFMPSDTYADLPVRKDLGEYLESLNPTFLRFPGGCVIEGRSLESMYSWKDSIGNAMELTINGETTTGDVAVRPQGVDIWLGNTANPYYTTYGLGFYEYFELCEALDCLAVPVLNAGMTCQVQSPQYIVYDLNSEEFAQCIQDALDLVEFCLGDETTEWGRVRIAMGHKDTFELKYVAIGNEQWQTEYHNHYAAFVEAFEEAAKENPALYGGIELVLANGTSSDSREGWTYIDRNPDTITTLIDEHYYQTPAWFLTNVNRYDSYDRECQAAVFLGEYAAQSNTLQAALAEAAYMTGIEDNADIVKMACYAPLFGNSTLNQWTPDMIFFSKDSVYGTINYYVQQLYANNVGTNVLPSEYELTQGSSEESAYSGKVGLGSWMSSVTYDNLVVTDNESGDVLYSNDFEDNATLDSGDWQTHTGTWAVKDGVLTQTNTNDPSDFNTGDAIYVGDTSWTNYTLTVDGVVLEGNEGFLIPVCVGESGDNIFWNIGGWNNTVSCLQMVEGGVKGGQVNGTVKNIYVRRNETYSLKVVVAGNNIKCYIGDTLYVDYTEPEVDPFYETVSVDANGDIIIKYVNVGDTELPVATVLNNFNADDFNSSATVTTLAGETLADTNSFDNPEKVAPVESTMDISGDFDITLPKYSLTIIRISHK